MPYVHILASMHPPHCQSVGKMSRPHVLSLFEQDTHRFIAVDGGFRPAWLEPASEICLTEADFDALEHAATRCQKRFGGHLPWTIGRDRSIRTSEMVGLVDAGSVHAEILPKIDRVSDSVPTARVRLLELVTFTERLPETSDYEASLQTNRQPFLETMIGVFADSLRGALLQGVYQAYRPEATDRTTIRGRIDFARQVTHNASRPDRIACRFPLHTADHALNRVLLDATVRLRAVSRRLRNRQILDEIEAMFDGIKRGACTAADCDHIMLSRLTERFAPPLRLARLFLSALSPDLTSGQAPGVTLLFDMNRLFEAYVARVAQVFLSAELVTFVQRSIGHLLRWPTDEQLSEAKYLHSLEPDLVFCALSPRPPLTVIADTKYKCVSRLADLDIDDTRQLFAYLMTWQARPGDAPATDALLLYPASENGMAQLGAGEYLTTMTANRLRLWVASLDLRSNTPSLESRRAVADQLRKVLVRIGLLP